MPSQQHKSESVEAETASETTQTETHNEPEIGAVADETKRVLPSELHVARRHSTDSDKSPVLPTTGERTERVIVTGTLTSVWSGEHNGFDYGRVMIKTPTGVCTAVVTNDEYLIEQVEALQSEHDDISERKPVEPTPVRVVGEAEAVHEDGEFVSTVIKEIDHIKPVNQNQYKRGMLKTAVNTLKRIEEVDESRPGVDGLDEHKSNAKEILNHIRSMD